MAAMGFYLRVGDATTCGGKILTGDETFSWYGVAGAREGDAVSCGQHPGMYRILGGIADTWDEGRRLAGTLDSFSSCPCSARFIQTIADGYTKDEPPAEKARLQAIARQLIEKKQRVEARDQQRVFAKSCLRGEGCNDAGEQQEPHTHFAAMAFYQAIPSAAPTSDSDVPQYGQSAKKKNPVDAIPKPKKRSALYKWLNGDHEEFDDQQALAAATRAANADKAVEGASVFGLIGGRAITSGTWAVKLGEVVSGAGRIAASGPGAPLAAIVMGMMPGKLNEGEQDYLDRLRLEQMHEAPTRVRYTWEEDEKGNPVPHGWHTPPGQDRVRVRKMAWDSYRQAYTFSTEEDPRITLIWTPDSSGVNVPSTTGNRHPVRIPNPVIVDPLPEDTRIDATISPAPQEKNFADYILILPLPNSPPIYIYLSKPPVEFLEVDLYSNLEGRSREGKYHADHIPSKAAVKEYYRNLDPLLDKDDINDLANEVASIIVPIDAHRKISETYGRRNSEAQIKLDASNLRVAVDRNLDAIKPALKEHGATEAQIEAARVKMHKLNSSVGLYK